MFSGDVLFFLSYFIKYFCGKNNNNNIFVLHSDKMLHWNLGKCMALEKYFQISMNACVVFFYVLDIGHICIVHYVNEKFHYGTFRYLLLLFTPYYVVCLFFVFFAKSCYTCKLNLMVSKWNCIDFPYIHK